MSRFTVPPNILEPPQPRIVVPDRPIEDEIAEAEDRALVTISPEEIRARASSNLYFFARFVLGFDHMQIRPHLKLTLLLQGLGNKYRSLRVTMPRGALKTTISSKAYPMWLTANNPNLSCLIAANTHDNACKMVSEIRQHWVSNDRLKRLFPECVPNRREVRWTDECATLNRSSRQSEGTYEAAGVGTSLPSRHYHVIVCDDLVRAQIDNDTGEEYQPDEADISKAILFVKMIDGLWVMSKERIELHIGTRWAVHDVISWLEDTQRCERNYSIKAVDEHGKATYPWKYDLEELERLRGSMGDYMFETQYMNAPRSLADQIFMEDSILSWHTLPKKLAIGITVDPASSKKKRADYTGMVVVGVDPATDNWYVLETVRAKLSPAETLDRVIALNDRWHPSAIGIETVGYQEALREGLVLYSRDNNVHLPILQLKTPTKITKEQRIRGLQPRFMRNNVDNPGETISGIFLKPTMKELRREIVDFPDNANDDLLDALAYHRQLHPSAEAEEREAPPEFLTLGYFLNLQRRADVVRSRRIL